MTLFTDTPGRERNPLGGQAADGFGMWLVTTEMSVRETRDLMRGKVWEQNNPLPYVTMSAASHYGTVLAEWQGVLAGRGEHVRDELARDHFEVGLISAAMSAHGAAEFARERGYKDHESTSGGRPMADVAAEYRRACTILAKYVGTSELTVAACGGDQAALSALRATV